MIKAAERVRTAIVTGAGSGLGRALALRLARDGWHVVLADIDDAACAATRELAEAAGGSARSEHLDVTQIDAWTELVSRLEREIPRLDLLVNNAGVAVTGEIGLCPLENWRWQLEVNLFGVIHGCHACRGWCLRSPGSHIVNIASAAALVAYPELGAYNVSKAGVFALSETLYAEMRRHGVGVTAVCPGYFQTNLLKRTRFQNELEHATAEQCMQQSRISADAVADAVIAAVKHRRMYVVLPREERIRWFWKRLLPTTMLNLTARSYAQFRRRTEPVPAVDPSVASYA